MLAEAADGLVLLLSWTGLITILAGVLTGAIFAALPGLGAPNAMALLLPVTFAMEPVQAITFLVAINGATGFLGAVSSILINVPGDGVNAATTLDGYPLSRQGRAGEAIAAAGTSSALGALFGVLVLVISLPVLRTVLLSVGPPEVFAFAVVGVALVASVSRGSTVKGLIAGLIGLLLGTIGLDIIVGEQRFVFGYTRLFDGIPLIPAIIGLFAFPELIQLLTTNQSVSRSGDVVKGGIRTGIIAVLKRPMLLLRSSAIGTGIGIVPGVGGAVSTWIAYFAAQKRSKDPDSFGKGNIEGVIAPEAANDSKEGGTLMPLLALGVPGSITSAILLTALMFHGITPGQRLFANDMPVIFSIIFTLVVANVVVAVVGIAATNYVIKLTMVPIGVLAPIIVVLALLGSYSDQQAAFGIVIALLFGALGYLMVRLDYGRPPLLIGLILLSVVEGNYHTSVRISRGTHDFLFRPVTAMVLILVVLALVGPPLVRWLRKFDSRTRRPDRQPQTGDVSGHEGAESPVGVRGGSDSSDGVASDLAGREMVTELEEDAGAGQEAGMHPGLPALKKVQVGDLIFQGVLLAVCVVLWFETSNYAPESRLFPRMVLAPLFTLTFVALMRDLIRLRDLGAAGSEWMAPTGTRARPAWAAALWILAFPALTALIGMTAAAFVYATGFVLAFQGRSRSLSRALLAVFIGALLASLIHYVFGGTLGIRVPSGIWL
jgi:putative tricarboxylic transport membrane protein